MVKNLSLSLLLIFLSGCGFYSIPSAYIDPEFQVYIDKYKQDKLFYLNTTKIRRITITFKEMTDLDGECRIVTFGNLIYKKGIVSYRKISIDPDNWNRSSDIDRMLLVYHELGHCDLNLMHSAEDTIMNEYSISSDVFSLNPEYYLNALFTKGK